MSIVAPNGQVRLLANVPLDNKYEDSMWFQNKTEQTAYFLSFTPIHVMANAVRVRNGVIAVDTDEDTIRQCNYLMFQNQNFSDKWFYACIIGTEYVNNNMTNVIYEIDPLQTYGLDVTLMDCYIERETTATDGMFEHLIDEGIKVSEYVKTDLTDVHYYMGNMDVVMFSGTDVVDDGSDVGAVVTAPCFAYQGFMNGLRPKLFHVLNDQGYWDNNEIDRMTDWLNTLTTAQQTDAIVGAIMYPRDLIALGSEAMHYPVTAKEISIPNFTNLSLIDGYRPKNKKLYNSPYCVVYMGCSDGQIQILQPEYLTSNSKVALFANVSLTPSVMAIARNYRNKYEDWETAITFDAFPQVAMSLDGYKAWVASGGLSRLKLNTGTAVAKDVLNITGGLIDAVGGQMDYSANAQFGTQKGMDKAQARGLGGVGETLNGITDLVSDVGNAMITLDVAKSLPPSIKGSMNTSVLMAYLKLDIYAEQRTINKDVAKSIDNYFTMYGYKVNIVKKPTLHNRSRFTYVKTKGCKVTGGAPTEAIANIERILDSGCRFWADHEHIGDYDYADNTPLGNNAN